MKLLCLCPTYGRPKMLANALACFLAQDYPVEKRLLMILDDAGQIGAPQDGSCIVISTRERFPSLPAKYNHLLKAAKLAWNEWDAAVVWDDDDVYLPGYLSAHAAALQGPMENCPACCVKWSQPALAWSDYSGRLLLEETSYRFHATLAIRRQFLLESNGWIDTLQADFDQQMILKLHAEWGQPGRPQSDNHSEYIFRWKSTGHHHGQSLMKSADNTDWYSRFQIDDPKPVKELQPQFDSVTKQYYRNFGYGAVT